MLVPKEEQLMNNEKEQRKKSAVISSPRKEADQGRSDEPNAPERLKTFGKLMKAYTKIQFLNISRHKTPGELDKEKNLPVSERNFSRLPEKQRHYLDNLVPNLSYLLMKDKHKLFDEGVFKYHCVQQIGQGIIQIKEK